MRRVVLCTIFLAMARFAVVPAWGLDPAKPPGQNFNLSSWKLQTPLPGTPEIKQPQLATYTSNIFYTAADGSMVCWCPTDGDTIDAGGYPRTELRQLAPGGDWVVSNNVVHLLTATCKVLTNPPSGKTIIGQIHGNDTGSEALKLLWRSGQVQAAVKDNYGGNQIYLNIGTWSLGSTLSYSIQESNHLITVTVNGNTVTYLLNSTWDADTYYFKAGNYCQDNSTTTNTVCVVAFYALNGAAGAVGAPTFSPVAGTYSSAQTVTIKTPTTGASIRYTTDGTTPSSTTGTPYSSPVNISANTTLKAIAYDSILPASTVTSGAYTIQVVPPIFSPGAGAYTDSQSVTISSTTSGASLRYTVDGSTPTSTTGTPYTTPVTISTNTMLKAIAYRSGMLDSTVTSGAYTIQVVPPAFSPVAGTYTGSQSVTISTTTSDASIRYTVDGSAPTSTTGTLYTTPVTISTNTTLNAIAYRSGMLDSTVASSAYTIQAVAAPPTLSIVASGPNAIISWPSSADPAFALESTTNLAAPTWVSAGTPVVIGGQFMVTNALNSDAQFYRLKK